MALGYYNTTYTVNDATAKDTLDRLLVVGNGEFGTPEDALRLMKSGDMAIGNFDPDVRLDVDGEIRPGNSGDAAGANNIGALRWDGTDIQYSDGTAWNALGSPWNTVTNGINYPGTTNRVGINNANPRAMLHLDNGFASYSVGRANVAGLNFGNVYTGFNAHRDATTGDWLSVGDGANNGGSILLSNLFGDMHFINIGSNGATNQTYTDAEVMDSTRMLLDFAGDLSLGKGNAYATTRFEIWDTEGLNGDIGTQTIYSNGTGINSSFFAESNDTGDDAGVQFAFTTISGFDTLPTSPVEVDYGIWSNVTSGVTESYAAVFSQGATPNTPDVYAGFAGTDFNADFVAANFSGGYVAMNDSAIYLRGPGDRNHGLRYAGAGVPFGTLTADGPVLFGFSGGGLGYTDGGEEIALRWDGNGNVGIGTNAPAQTLDVQGSVRIADGTEQNGYVLTSDAAGNASWQAGGGGSSLWTDNSPDISYTTGNVGIGTNAPTGALQVDAGSGGGALIQDVNVDAGGANPLFPT